MEPGVSDRNNQTKLEAMILDFIIAKSLKFLNRPAVRGSNLSKHVDIGPGCNIINCNIDRYTYLGKNCVAVNASIGSFCSIASYCCIGGGAHPTNMLSSSPVFYKGRNAFGKHFQKVDFVDDSQVTLGHDVWIGEKVFVRDGITIGNGSIIGANAVVTKDVPPYAIMGGAPAKLIRYRFSEDVIKKIQDIKWWLFSDKELATFCDSIGNQEITLEVLNRAIKKIYEED